MGRLARTLRHLRPRQVFWRARSVAYRRLWDTFPGLLPRRLAQLAERWLPLLWGSDQLRALAEVRRKRVELRPSQADGILANRFSLTNRAFEFERGVDWHRPDLRIEEPLAGFELHYQGYLEDLALAWGKTGDARYARKWETLVRSWIENNPPRGRDFARFSWSPYVIGERLRNWLSSAWWFKDSLTVGFRTLFERAVAQQAAFLAANLEYDLQGNHLLQNLCGLVVGASVLDGRQARFARQDALLRLARIVEEQLVADGMHEERSFSYHLKALSDLLDVLAVTEAQRIPSTDSPSASAARTLKEAVARMAGMLAATLEEVGGLPLMNDSEEVPRLVAEQAIAEAARYCRLRRPSPSERCEGSGYLVGAVGPWSVVFDVGPAGPDHQMGHAHADHLGFEAWYAGRKLISDSGNFTYNHGEKRNYYRGTSAHSTIRIDGEDSLEVWASFRVGRRPRHHRGAILTRTSDHILWTGEHDGFAHLPGRPVHRRLFEVRPRGICVHDRIEGRGEHLVESFLHFHPDTVVDRCPDREVDVSAFALPACLADGRRSVWQWKNPGSSGGLVVALWPEGCTMQVERLAGTYAPRQSVELSSTVLCMRGTVALPVDLGWLILEG